MSWSSKVIWSEGTFLQPQHFQQHDRYLESLIEGRARPSLAYGWGFGGIELDTASLAVGKIQLAAAHGVFPDGTPFSFPQQDSPPEPLDIDPQMKDELVVLALPVRRAGMAEVSLDGVAEVNLTRYSVDETEVPDSNAPAGSNAALQIGRLQLRLMRKRDVTGAYTTLGVVHVIERRADRQVVLQKDYIPPVLHTGANPTIAAWIRELHGLLHQRGETLEARLSQPGRGGVAEVADFLLLQTVNRNEPRFSHLAALPLLHPERLFAECLGLAGDLATFSQTDRRPPQFPAYEHDDLQHCFTPLMSSLRQFLSMVLEQNAIPIELQERKYGLKVAIIPDPELLKSAGFVLAASAQLPADVLRTRFPSQVKIGPVERIRDLVNLQLPGIPLRALPVAPRQIPFHAGFDYFELERGGDLWKQLERSGGLAMHIAGEFPGLELEFWAIKG